MSTTSSSTLARSSALGPLLTPEEAAAYLGTSVRHVRELRTSGRLSFVMVGRFIRFTAPDLEAFIAAGREQRRLA